MLTLIDDMFIWEVMLFFVSGIMVFAELARKPLEYGDPEPYALWPFRISVILLTVSFLLKLGAWMYEQDHCNGEAVSTLNRFI